MVGPRCKDGFAHRRQHGTDSSKRRRLAPDNEIQFTGGRTAFSLPVLRRVEKSALKFLRRRGFKLIESSKRVTVLHSMQTVPGFQQPTRRFQPDHNAREALSSATMVTITSALLAAIAEAIPTRGAPRGEDL